MALFGPWLVSADPLRQTPDAMLPIGSAGHLAGTDDLGRDQLARLVYGAQPLILVSIAATTRITSSIDGNASSTSTPRIVTCSTQPR